ncbi:FlgD immunoglobulin-like domain containing protein [Streptomyces sp. NPDC006339]|uniref:FlgD immunoglobulin-like domain containing protein n=1 Tax=Streptomyces sp. NPDC006339 TaxID=3156755 RepID=UPI0033BF5B07
MYGPARVRAHTRGAIAVATAVGITAGLATALTTTPAVAADAPTASDEVVIPNLGREMPRYDTMKHAGSTGYAHELEGSGTVWTDYATGAHTPITAAQADGHSGLYATIGTEPLDQPRTVTVHRLGSDAKTSVTIPGGQVWSRTYNADTALAYTQDATGLTSLTLYGAAEDGTTTARPITDVPKGGQVAVLKQDLRGAILRIRPLADGTGGGTFLLDYATGTLKQLPAGMGLTGWFVLGDRHVVSYPGNGGPLSSVPRDNPTAQPVQTVLPARVGNEGPGVSFAVTGDTVVYQRSLLYPENGRLAGHALRAIALGGGTPTELLKHAKQGSFAIAPDGGVLVPGGTSATDWAVHRITAGADGTPAVARLHEIPVVPRAIEYLALGGGRLSQITRRGEWQDLHDVDTDLTSGTPTATAPKRRFSFVVNPVTGLASLGDGDSVALWGTTLGAPIETNSYKGFGLPGAETVVDAAGRYVVAKAGSTTYVGDLENYSADNPDVLLTLQNTPAAVWGTKAWKPAGTASASDLVHAYDLKTKATSPSVDLGSGCRPTDLRAVGRWLYWACGATKAGVYDQTLKKSVPVPTGEALLGDGFVVRHEGDKLKFTDALTGTTRDLADLPASASGSGRGTTWTVDKFGANVAYVDADRNIHVKRVPVAAQPFTRTDDGDRYGGPLAVRARMSRAVGAWTAEIKNTAGRTVRIYRGATGTAAGVGFAWDGRDELGRGVEGGRYTYVLNAQPKDGAGTGQRLTGTLDAWDNRLTTLPGTFRPLTPTRLMDTRTGLGVPKARVGAGKTVTLKVTGSGGVPATGVTAVVLNVTAVNPTTAGFISVYPSGTNRTSASNLNFTAGRTVPNSVVVPVVDGKIHFYNSGGSTDLLADVAGYYQEGTGGSAYKPVTPSRLLDTRSGLGAPKAKVGERGTVTLTVPDASAKAVVLNVTATNATKASYVSVQPYGAPRAAVSNLNVTAGRTVANHVVVPVVDGKVTFYNNAGTVDLIADVAGYFTEGAAGTFTAMQPFRALDTRFYLPTPPEKIGAGQTRTLWVGGQSIVPGNATAVVVNVTVTNPTASGYVSVYPYGAPRPAVSSVNFTAGQTVANLIVVPVKDGQVTLYNHSGTVDVIADVFGYYTG